MLVVAALGALVIFAQQLPAGNPIVPPQEVHVTNTTVVQVPPMDDETVSHGAAIANQSLIVNTIQPIPVEWTNVMCALPNIWTTTPSNVTIEFPDLRALAERLRQAAGVLLGLAVAGIGLATIYGADVHERGGRLIWACVLSTGNLTWWEWGIGLNNSLTGVISPPDVCGSLITPHITLAAPDPGTAVGAPVLVIVYAAVSLLLLIGLAFRLGMLDVLIAAGSLALICYATPQTEHVAHWYQRLAFGTLFGQVLLAIGLVAARALSSLTGGLGATILSMVVLLICRKLLTVLSAQNHERGGYVAGRMMVLAARRLITKVF